MELQHQQVEADHPSPSCCLACMRLDWLTLFFSVLTKGPTNKLICLLSRLLPLVAFPLTVIRHKTATSAVRWNESTQPYPERPQSLARGNNLRALYPTLLTAAAISKPLSSNGQDLFCVSGLEISKIEVPVPACMCKLLGQSKGSDALAVWP